MTSNKQIVIKALQTELETVKNAAVTHEKEVYEVDMAWQTAQIREFFSGIVGGINRIDCGASEITVYPNSGNDYSNRIELSVRSSWSSKKSEWYVELKSYRPDMSSNTDNSDACFYYTVLSKIANCFTLICEEFLNVWRPKMLEFEKAKEDFYSKMYDIEREIRNIESQIDADSKLEYHKTGFAVTLNDYWDWDWKHDGVNEYTIHSKPHDMRVQIGRARWDYMYFNSFKVVSYPKTKHGKVVIDYMRADDTAPRRTELNKTRYADLVDAVYAWQTKGAAERQKQCEDKLKRNKANA